MIVITSEQKVYYTDLFEPGDVIIDPDKGLYRLYDGDWMTIEVVEPCTGQTVDYIKRTANPHLTKVEFDVGGEKIVA